MYQKIVQLDNDEYRHDNRKCLERVKKLTLLASNSFHSLNISNQWNIPYNHWHGMANRKYPFDNCGGEHYALDFPHPHDEAKIKKAKKERKAHKGSGGYGGGHGGGRQGGIMKWSNYNKDGDINEYVNGVQKRGNAWI